MPVTPTGGFQLQRLPEPLSIPTNIGRIDVPELQQAFRGGMQNVQAARLVGPQTQSALATYAQQQAEARNAAILAEARRAKLAEEAQLAQEANIRFQKARGAGPAGVAIGNVPIQFGDTTVNLPFAATPEGGAQVIGGSIPSAILSGFGKTGEVYTEVIASRIDSMTGKTINKVQKYRNGPFGIVPEGAPFEVDAGMATKQMPVPAVTPVPATALSAPPVAAGQPALMPAKEGEKPTAQIMPAAAEKTGGWFDLRKPAEATDQQVYAIQYFVPAGAKNAEQAIDIANRRGIPAIGTNPSNKLPPGPASTNAREIQNENRKAVSDMGKDLQASQNTVATIGRTLKVGDEVTTFAKIPIIGNRINELRAIIDPQFQSIEALSKIPALTQAKSFFGSRVTNFDLESLQEAMGNVNMPADVRKESFAAMLSGIQMATEYKRAALDYVKEYPSSPITDFDSYYSEYLQNNPVYVGTPGVIGFGMNQNRMTFDAYNALKNKGYENPNQIYQENPSIITSDGKLDDSKLPIVGDPWPPTTKPPPVNVSLPTTPVSDKAGAIPTITTKEQFDKLPSGSEFIWNGRKGTKK